MEPFEPPKYIASLIAAINDGAKSAQLGALAFTAIGLFLLATAFSATDEDLLLNHAISISQLGGAQVPVVFAFGLAPTVFLAAHLYTLIRYDMLAGNVRQLLADLPGMVPEEADRERCRQLLANVEFINALAMPPKSRSSSWLFRWTATVLIAVFPVTVLLLVQISSLRLQHEVVNWIHHACLAIDLVLLVWFFGRQVGDSGWSFWTAPTRRKLALCWLPVAIASMDLTWLRVPGEDSTTVGEDILVFADYDRGGHEQLLDRRTRVLLALPVQPIDLLLCPRVGWGCRFLTVTYRPVVAKVWDTAGFVALRAGAEANDKSLAAIESASLAGRVLRFADLSGSQLFAANLTGADLRRARLNNAQLKRAVLVGAQLEGANFSNASMQEADLSSAAMEGVSLVEAQMQGAKFREAHMEFANLNYAHAEGADLTDADLRNAEMKSVQLQGAAMTAVFLRGANLQGAQLTGADMTVAQLEGAELVDAILDGAVLNGSNLSGTDSRGASLWNIVASDDTEIGLADFRGTKFTRPDSAGQQLEFQFGLLALLPKAARQRVQRALIPGVNETALPRISTKAGRILVTDPNMPALASLTADRMTTDVTSYDEALAKFIAQLPNDYGSVWSYPDPSHDSRWWEKDRSLAKLLNCEMIAKIRPQQERVRPEVREALNLAATTCDQRQGRSTPKP